MSQEKDIFKAGSRTYYLSSRLFPKRIRDDVYKLYSFVRVADDYVDNVPPEPKKLAELTDNYKKAMNDTNFESIAHGWDDLETRIVKNIVQLSRKYKFNSAWVESFLSTMKSDLSPRTPKTLVASLAYVYGSAEVIGLMMTRILKLDSKRNIRRYLHMEQVKNINKKEKIHKRHLKNNIERIKYRATKQTKVTPEQIERHQEIVRRAAMLQGRAMQWINFARDINEDNTLGRQYFPKEDLDRFKLKDLSEKTVRENPEAFKKFMDLQLKRYREWQAEASVGSQYIPKALSIPIETAASMYEWTAKKIEKDPLIVFSKKVKPRKHRVLIKATRNLVKRKFKS